MKNDAVDILNSIVKERPFVHPRKDGGQRCIGLDKNVLNYLFDVLKPTMQTLETGCGLSTLVFALAGCLHTAIVPNEAHIIETKKAAKDLGVSFDSVDFIVARSENCLPHFTHSKSLDVVLIDGGHAFPIPFIDWFYTNRILEEGGLLFIDDIDLKTINILYSFLEQQPEWELLKVIHKTAVYRKLEKTEIEDVWDYWQKQPFNDRGIAGHLKKIQLVLKNKL